MEKHRGRPRKWDRFRRVRYALDVDQNKKGCLRICTVGVPWMMMIDAMEWLRPVSQKQYLERDELEVKRNGCVLELLNLSLENWDQHFCSASDIHILFESYINTLCKEQDVTLDIKKVTYEKLINL